MTIELLLTISFRLNTGHFLPALKIRGSPKIRLKIKSEVSDNFGV